MNLTEDEIDKLAMLCASLKEIPFSFMPARYTDFIPKEILSLSAKSITIKEHCFNAAIEQKDFNRLFSNLSSAHALIKDAPYNPYSYNRRKYKDQRLSNTELFNFMWNKIVLSDLHIDMFKFMMKEPGYRHVLRGSSKINKLFVEAIIKNYKVTTDFIDFVISDEWSKVFKVPSKMLIVNFLSKKGRKDDMYLFLNTGSKGVNDLVIKNALKKDLPFLMAANGVAAKKSLEKKLNK